MQIYIALQYLQIRRQCQIESISRCRQRSDGKDEILIILELVLLRVKLGNAWNLPSRRENTKHFFL